jgi:hypothetical protein
MAAVATVVAAFGAGTALAASAATAHVTNSLNAGPGSFRAAIANANADSSIGKIIFHPNLAPIMLTSPVVYNGDQSLDILAHGAVLDGSGLAGAAVFQATTDGNLSVSWLTIRDAPEHGLWYEVPGNATGVKKVVLLGVKALGNGGHGVLVDDQMVLAGNTTAPWVNNAGVTVIVT